MVKSPFGSLIDWVKQFLPINRNTEFILNVHQTEEDILNRKKVIITKYMYLRMQIEQYFYLKTANKPCASPFFKYFNDDV